MLAVSGGILAAIPWWTGLWFLLPVCFVPLLIIEDDTAGNNADFSELFNFSFIFFFTWNFFATWWIARINIPGGMTVIILNSLLMSLVFLLYGAIKRGTGANPVILVLLWAAFEYLHHKGDLSWPWLSLGNGLAGDIRIVQWYEYTGMQGGGIWVMLVNVLFFAGIRHYIIHGINRLFLYRLLLTIMVVLIPVTASIKIYDSMDEDGGKANFLIVQSALDPYGDKFSLSNSGRLDMILKLTAQGMDERVDYIVTPETSVDSIQIADADDEFIQRIKEFMEQFPGAGLVLGATTFSPATFSGNNSFTVRTDEAGRAFEVQNSALFFTSGTYQWAYHKYYLANGVEQVPFEKVFGFLGGLSLNMGGVSGSLKPGPGPGVFSSSVADSLVLGTLICFESSYGEYAARMTRKGAEIILVITNDGWFKNTGAYRQHLRLSRIRAIETRRDIVRAANTGISCHITRKGDIAASLDPWETDFLPVRPSVNRELTFYSRTGDYIGRIALFFSVLMVLNFLTVKYISRK